MQRYRSRTKVVTVPAHMYSNRVIFDHTTDVELGEHMWDQPTPHFGELVSSGATLPVNPMTQHKNYVVLDLDEKVTWERNAGHGWREYTYTGPISLPGQITPDRWAGRFNALPSHNDIGLFSRADVYALLQQAYADANTEGFDIGTFIAELSKTVRMISRFGANCARRGSLILNDLRRHSNYTDSYRAFSSAWLEKRYGWRILMYELRDMNRAIHQFNNGSAFQDLIRRTRTISDTKTFESSEVMNNTIYTPTGSTSGKTYTNIRSTKHDVEEEVRAGVGVSPYVTNSVFFDPLVTVSEIIPYHLIVNWFFGTKSVIEAFSPFANTSLEYSFITRTTRRVVHSTLTLEAPDDWTFRGDLGPYSCQLVDERTDRAPISPRPVVRPQFNLRLPQVADLAAMIGGIAFRLRRLIKRT